MAKPMDKRMNANGITAIEIGKPEQLHTLISLAHEIWPLVYGEMISASQIKYMLEMMYGYNALENQWQNGHRFQLYFLDGIAVGYSHWHLLDFSVARIEKIYLHPGAQGKGNGRFMLGYMAEAALAAGAALLELNVNRNNAAVQFYKALGFTVHSEVDKPIGNGYFMNDYIMRKNLV